ncbi:torsin-1A-interacting protein 2-like isoform X2 [Channa argus]|uniref:torsin-1A-interacting protein 2-like isoform X2 n=1 Tax=Channa argus TaxID=215402 RepID=UPI0035220ED9
MDCEVLESKVSRPLRRSTRRSSVKALLSYEPTPRAPLKRTKRSLENQAPVAAVNGSREVENGSENEESPSKKIRLETGGAVGSSGDEIQMDVQESVDDIENEQDQDMDIEQESSHGTYHPKICQDQTIKAFPVFKIEAIGDVNLSPRVLLGERCKSSHAANEDADCRAKTSTKGPALLTKNELKSPANRHDLPIPKTTVTGEYRNAMQARKPTQAVKHYVPNKDPGFERSYEPTVHLLNNIPARKETVYLKKQERLKKTAVIRRSSRFSFGGFMLYFGCLALLVMLSSAALMAYKKLSVLQRSADEGRRLYRAANPEMFAGHLSLLEAQFPTQRSELWKRSKIHLERHLKTSQPTEPVSLILTAGNKAEKTLRCLAQALASSFSSALNTSVLHIEGASKAGQDSDAVKMDIDSQLQAAFEGDKPVAVIHRFEELPPGSTLIFYRYCDHENAAFKRVFLLFTVLLSQDEISSELSLKNVEEMVQDYVQERLVGSNGQTAFNEMDTDKYGGLWSRISHLILPVVSEKEIEQKGC